MKVIFKNLIILSSIAVVYMGLNGLAFKNTIFDDSKAPCCNEGQCTGVSCGATSQFELISNCSNTLYTTCKDCLDYEAWNQLCYPDGENGYCDDNGVKYYGNGVWETRTITFNNTSPSGGTYTMGGTGYTPVTSGNFKYLSTPSLSATNYFQTGSPPYTISWVFDRWNFGSSSNPVNYQVTANATIYAIYKRYIDPAKSSLSTGIEIRNYPNPFNPTTQIEYNIIEPTDVTLIVYNSLGEEIEVLVNKFQTSGNYRINFNAKNIPSGIYYYKLTTNENSIVKRMLLLK